MVPLCAIECHFSAKRLYESHLPIIVALARLSLGAPARSPFWLVGLICKRGMLFQRCFHRLHEVVPIAVNLVDIRTKGTLEGLENPFAGGRYSRVAVKPRATQQVDEGEKLLRPLGLDEIHQRPRLGVEVALVTAAESGVCG